MTAGQGMINTLPINSNGVSVAIWQMNDLTPVSILRDDFLGSFLVLTLLC